MKCKWKDRLTYHISKNSHLTISSVGEAVGEQTSYTAGKMKNIKPPWINIQQNIGKLYMNLHFDSNPALENISNRLAKI